MKNILKPIRHGEIMLVPANKVPKGKTTKHTNFIIGHSETGHHHVIESRNPFEMTETETGELYIKLFGDAAIVHKKTTDKHKTLTISKGIYQRFHDTEYDPFAGVIQAVKD
jgi:hypothetical protein